VNLNSVSNIPEGTSYVQRIILTLIFVLVVWHVDPLVDGDSEIDDSTATVARQRPADNKKYFLCGPCRDVVNKPIGAMS
jgi:hypothetical protein